MDKLKNHTTRILLTGANGFLGQKCTDLILETTDYELCCTSHSYQKNPNKKNKHQFVQLDLLNHEALKELIKRFSPTHIIHCAAITSVEICEQQPELCQKMNVDVVDLLASLCEENNIHLTFLSTDFVFDGKNGPYNELAECNPCNAYGQSKLDAERVILASNSRAAILRTILVYGVIADKNRSNLVLWAKNKLQQGQSIHVVNDQWRMPTWVDDLAKACLLAVEKNAQGVYHISSDKQYSILDAVYLVADYWKLDKTLIHPIRAEEIGQRDNRPRKTGFILDKSKNVLGFQPTSFIESLASIDQQIKNINQ